MQQRSGFWNTTTGKSAIIGCVGLAGLVFLCLLCAIGGSLARPTTKQEATESALVFVTVELITPEYVAIPTPTVTPEPTLTPEPTATPEPTVTPPPAETPTPALTPTGIPEAAQPKLAILNHYNYIDSSGRLNIVGEVQNNSDTPLELVQIDVTFYDDAGKVIGTDFTFATLDVIPPGGKAPFVLTKEQGRLISAYTLKPEDDPTVGALPPQDYVILNHKCLIEDDSFYVQGEVQNAGDEPAQFVKLIVTLYDVTGKVIGADFAYTDLDVIPPGETSSFEVVTAHQPDFNHYEIQIEGKTVEETTLAEPTAPP